MILLDVSLKETPVCVVDESQPIDLGAGSTEEPTDLVALSSSLGVTYGRIEAGPLSQWLVNWSLQQNQ